MELFPLTCSPHTAKHLEEDIFQIKGSLLRSMIQHCVLPRYLVYCQRVCGVLKMRNIIVGLSLGVPGIFLIQYMLPGLFVFSQTYSHETPPINILLYKGCFICKKNLSEVPYFWSCVLRPGRPCRASPSKCPPLLPHRDPDERTNMYA